ncbi:hypothetical protein AB0N20_29780 [Streptomyces griseoincarnatus]
MPATVRPDPLRVEFVFPDGQRLTCPLGGTEDDALAAELARGLPGLVHPLGQVAAPRTAKRYVRDLRKLVTGLTALGLSGGLGAVTSPMLVRHWLASSPSHVMGSRWLLLSVADATGAIPQPVVHSITGRLVKKVPKSTPIQPYTEGEWERLLEALRSVVAQAWSAHREARNLAAVGCHPAEGGLSRENVAWLLVREGPLSAEEFGVLAGCSPANKWAAVHVRQIKDALYPTSITLAAHRLLFAAYCGIVPDGIADLGLGDVSWAGESTVLLDYVKKRRGKESSTLTDRAVRLLERWLDLTSLLRAKAPEHLREELWLRTRRRRKTSEHPRVFLIDRIEMTSRRQWAQWQLVHLTGVQGDDGNALPIDSRRVRTTYLNQLSRGGWTGATTIDPNHTPAVEGDHYLSALTPAQREAVESIVEDGQADILRKAEPPAVLTDEEMARFAADLPEQARRLGVDAGALAELLGGERDVFTASCKDQLAGLYGPKGKPCPARPWVCLLCPLALFMPRHVPNLLRLRAFFSRQFRLMTTAEFMAVFGPYTDRLERELLSRFPDALLEAAAGEVTDTDAEIPLRPEEGTEPEEAR